MRDKFLLAVGVLIPATLAIALATGLGLVRMAKQTDTLYTDNAAAQHIGQLVAATLTVHETAMYQAATVDPLVRQNLGTELDTTLIPRVRQLMSGLRGDLTGNHKARLQLDGFEQDFQKFVDLHASASSLAGTDATSQLARSQYAARVDRLIEPVVRAGESLRSDEQQEAAATKRNSDANYTGTLRRLGWSTAGIVLLAMIVALGLSRDLVPRVRLYSAFAADVAAGHPTEPLRPGGHDELTALGAALNDMVSQRELAGAAQERQAEFIETLQVTGSEDEGQTLVQRHLQRSVAGSDVAVLKRNNSANRLEAATDLPAGSDLRARLVGAEPNSCVALRLGRTHREGSAVAPLLSCLLCAQRDKLSTCEPLLVGGEVIGSVLVSHELPLDPGGQAQIKNTVAQAAPMLANLRNLALAEFRANNDALTGLPNKRATEDTVKRMVAQANRSITPLCAVMLDLDHFKQINDRFGHALGDEVLAAVGTAIKAALRESDFAGRIGGEEFLILLPDTGLSGAEGVAEKVRLAVASITVPGVERAITASLGIAALLEQAGNASGLLREADRAQYAAKAAGRNRTVVSDGSDASAQAQAPAAATADVTAESTADERAPGDAHLALAGATAPAG